MHFLERTGNNCAMKIPDTQLHDAMRKRIASSTMTYEQMAARSGVPPRFIKRFKLREIDELSLTHALGLCRALGIRATFSTKE